MFSIVAMKSKTGILSGLAVLLFCQSSSLYALDPAISVETQEISRPIAENSDAASAAAVQGPTDNHIQNKYIAHDKGVDYLFKALSSVMKKPIITSAKAKKNSVTGDFDLTRPVETLTKVADDLGLIWYFDGSMFYIYDASEATSSMVQFSRRNFADLLTYLRENSLFDSRFPLKMNYSANTIYVAGPPKYVGIITAIATLMQDNPDEDLQQQVIETIKLRHAFVDDRSYVYREHSVVIPGIATAINNLLTETNRPKEIAVARQPVESHPETGTSEVSFGQSARFEQSDLDDLTNNVKVVSFTGRNSLMVKGTRAQVNMIKDLIASLDVPRKQIELSLWIVDINKDDLDSIGVNWGGQFKIGDEISALFNTGSVISSSQQNFFLAEVSALSQNNKANIVSRPFLLAQENMPALFDNTKNFYVRLAGENNVDLQTVTYGTTISVTPMISDDNKIIEMTLEILDGSTSVSQDGTTEVVDNLPVVGNTTINTLARVMEGQSLMIGGYTRDQVQFSVSKIPLLGDLPIVGGLFKNSSNTVSKTVRIFLIQPKVLKDFSTENSNLNKYIDEGWDAINQFDAKYNILNPGNKNDN